MHTSRRKGNVRLASVHYQPRSAKTSMDACRQFAPPIEEAARRKADLVVLGETLTYAGVNSTYADCAESIPGPSTEFIEMAIPSGTRR